MPIDVHAHYVPASIIDALETRAGDFGISVIQHPPSCSCALHFNYGLKVRPFFPRLIEAVDRRVEAMDLQGIDRQILSIWGDIFAYGLPREQSRQWHRFLNEHLSALCSKFPGRFSFLASVPLSHPDDAAAELDYAVKNLGAVGTVIAANIEGINLGEVDLDPFWRAATGHDVGVFIHPVQAQAVPRTERFALSQIAQYTQDTTLCVGSLIFSGVLDRYPNLRILLSHGGGTFPYLTGRFDCMHERMDRTSQGDVASLSPSAYLRRFYYDTILHDPSILNWLAGRVSIERLVLGTDYSFPPADMTPLDTLTRARFSAEEIRSVTETNPRTLFPHLPSAA